MIRVIFIKNIYILPKNKDKAKKKVLLAYQ